MAIGDFIRSALIEGNTENLLLLMPMIIFGISLIIILGTYVSDFLRRSDLKITIPKFDWGKKKKSVKVEEEEDYAAMIEKLKKEKNIDIAIGSLATIAAEFFKDTLEVEREYTLEELSARFNSRGKKKLAKFCDEMSEAFFTKDKITKGETLKLINKFERIAKKHTKKAKKKEKKRLKSNIWKKIEGIKNIKLQFNVLKRIEGLKDIIKPGEHIHQLSRELQRDIFRSKRREKAILKEKEDELLSLVRETTASIRDKDVKKRIDRVIGEGQKALNKDIKKAKEYYAHTLALYEKLPKQTQVERKHVIEKLQEDLEHSIAEREIKAIVSMTKKIKELEEAANVLPKKERVVKKISRIKELHHRGATYTEKKFLSSVNELAKEIKHIEGKAKEGIVQEEKDFIKKFRQFIKHIRKLWEESLEDINVFTEEFLKKVKDITEEIRELDDRIYRIEKKIFGHVEDFGGHVGERIKKKLNNMLKRSLKRISRITKALEKSKQEAKEHIENQEENILGMGNKIWNSIKNFAYRTEDEIETLFFKSKRALAKMRREIEKMAHHGVENLTALEERTGRNAHKKITKTKKAIIDGILKIESIKDKTIRDLERATGNLKKEKRLEEKKKKLKHIIKKAISDIIKKEKKDIILLEDHLGERLERIKEDIAKYKEIIMHSASEKMHNLNEALKKSADYMASLGHDTFDILKEEIEKMEEMAENLKWRMKNIWFKKDYEMGMRKIEAFKKKIDFDFIKNDFEILKHGIMDGEKMYMKNIKTTTEFIKETLKKRKPDIMEIDDFSRIKKEGKYLEDMRKGLTPLKKLKKEVKHVKDEIVEFEHKAEEEFKKLLHKEKEEPPMPDLPVPEKAEEVKPSTKVDIEKLRRELDMFRKISEHPERKIEEHTKEIMQVLGEKPKKAVEEKKAKKVKKVEKKRIQKYNWEVVAESISKKRPQHIMELSREENQLMDKINNLGREN